MIHQGNWCISLLQDFEFENVGPSRQFLPLAGNDKLAVAAPSYWTVNSQATEQEQAAAKKFIEWLYTSETGKNYLYNEFKFIPVLEGETTMVLTYYQQTFQNTFLKARQSDGQTNYGLQVL